MRRGHLLTHSMRPVLPDTKARQRHKKITWTTEGDCGEGVWVDAEQSIRRIYSNIKNTIKINLKK